MKNKMAAMLLTLALWVLFGPCLPAPFAQTPPAATIQGTILDEAGEPVPHVLVKATHKDTGVESPTRSNRLGEYLINPLQPGPYNVEFTAKGYQRLLRENINAPASQSDSLDVKLKVAGPNPLMTNSDAPATLDTDSVRGSTILDPTSRMPSPMAPSSSVQPARLAELNGAVLSPELLASVAAVATPAAVPLFRDPIHDGAADPVVIWNRARHTWWMLYTNRRADLDDPSGVTWVHGTHIGIAESADGGAHWHYVSEADIPVPSPDYTLWAPEIIFTGGLYHMFLTVVPGTFTDWNHPRHILHLTSTDLLHWKPLEDVNLPSDRTIDACVFKLPSGDWRLWYKNEADHSNVYFSDSPDLVHWTPKGIATTNHGEGPVVFQWHGHYWLINDPHAGLAVFRSDDLTTWRQQPNNILREPGTQPTDRAPGSHADVVIDATRRAWLFYFTQQGGENASPNTKGYARRSVLHVTELHESNGILTVDRNAPAYIHMLPPPANKKSDGSAIVPTVPSVARAASQAPSP